MRSRELSTSLGGSRNCSSVQEARRAGNDVVFDLAMAYAQPKLHGAGDCPERKGDSQAEMNTIYRPKTSGHARQRYSVRSNDGYSIMLRISDAATIGLIN